MLVAEHSGPGSCRAQPWEEGEGWQAGNVDAVAAAVGEEGVAAGVVRWVLGARWDMPPSHCTEEQSRCSAWLADRPGWARIRAAGDCCTAVGIAR